MTIKINDVMEKIKESLTSLWGDPWNSFFLIYDEIDGEM